MEVLFCPFSYSACTCVSTHRVPVPETLCSRQLSAWWRGQQRSQTVTSGMVRVSWDLTWGAPEEDAPPTIKHLGLSLESPTHFSPLKSLSSFKVNPHLLLTVPHLLVVPEQPQALPPLPWCHISLSQAPSGLPVGESGSFPNKTARVPEQDQGSLFGFLPAPSVVPARGKHTNDVLLSPARGAWVHIQSQAPLARG